MKLIFILISSIIIGVSCDVDYCEIQKERCTGEHVACMESKNSELWSNYQAHQWISYQRTYVVMALNMLKSYIGKGSRESYPKAANFTTIVWNDELEQLASIAVSKITIKDDVCALTETTDATYMVFYEDSANETMSNDQFIKDAMEHVLELIIKSPVKWWASYMAHTSQMGCSWAEYDVNHEIERTDDTSRQASENQSDEENAVVEQIDKPEVESTDNQDQMPNKLHVRSFMCILDTVAEEYATYLEGEPCSACQPNETCNEQLQLCTV